MKYSASFKAEVTASICYLFSLFSYLKTILSVLICKEQLSLCCFIVKGACTLVCPEKQSVF